MFSFEAGSKHPGGERMHVFWTQAASVVGRQLSMKDEEEAYAG